MPSYSVPGADDLTGPVERLPLPGQEDYIAEILTIEETSKPNFDGVVQDFLTVKFDIQSFADGAPLEDIDGNKVDSRWIWKDLDPTRMGFKQDGTASISRQFFLAANGISDLNAKIPAGDTDDLISRKVILSLIVYNKKMSGAQANRITAIKPISRRRGQAAQADAAPVARAKAAPAVSDEYAAAVAGLVSLSDNPTPESIAQVKAALADAEKF